MPAQLTLGRSTGELAPVPFTQVDSQRLLVRTEKQTREDTDCTCLPVGLPVGPALTQPASLSSRPLTAGVAVSGLPGHAGLVRSSAHLPPSCLQRCLLAENLGQIGGILPIPCQTKSKGCGRTKRLVHAIGKNKRGEGLYH